MIMFSQADEKVLASLLRMKAAEMEPLLTFFKKSLEQTKTALIRAEGDTVARLQGRAGVLQEFLEAVETSASVLEKVRKK